LKKWKIPVKRWTLSYFSWGSDLFALEAQYIHEIRQIGEITPVPCTPDFVLGITSVRGSIYSALDIRKSFGAEERSVSPEVCSSSRSGTRLKSAYWLTRTRKKRNSKRDIKRW